MSVDFVGRVTRVMVIALVPLTVGGGLLAGRSGALGALAGGLISLGSFRWLAGIAARTSAAGGRVRLSAAALGAGLRHLLLFGVLALVLSSGAAHPVALLAGLSVLPPTLIALGLRVTRLNG